MNIQRIQPGARLSRVVIHNDVVYLSGITAPDRSKDFCGQLEQVLERLDQHLRDAGSDRTRLLSALIVLTNPAQDFAALNETWERWLPEGQAPARATIHASLAAPEILVEIIVTAAVSAT